MNPTLDKICQQVIDKYKKDKNVAGIILFGSAASGLFDKYADIDFYIFLKNKGRYSRLNFTQGKIKVDILFDTISTVKQYLQEEKGSVHRRVSHMLAYGKIIYGQTKTASSLQKAAKRNLTLKTKYSRAEILMHKYYIADFWGKVQRDIDKKEYLSFGINSQFLLVNILELFLKLNGEFFRPAREMSSLLFRLDKKFGQKFTDFYRAKTLAEKKKILAWLVDYIYQKSGGKLPKHWTF